MQLDDALFGRFRGERGCPSFDVRLRVCRPGCGRLRCRSWVRDRRLEETSVLHLQLCSMLSFHSRILSIGDLTRIRSRYCISQLLYGSESRAASWGYRRESASRLQLLWPSDSALHSSFQRDAFWAVAIQNLWESKKVGHLTSKLHMRTWFPSRSYPMMNPETSGSIIQCSMPTCLPTTGRRSALMWIVIIVSSAELLSLVLNVRARCLTCWLSFTFNS